MEKLIEKIETADAPKAVGPYSQAVRVNVSRSHLIFVSGQLPIDPLTGKLIEGSMEEATRRILENIQAILFAAGSSLHEVIRVEVFLKDLGDFQEMNKEYQKHFSGDHFPARQTIEVARLPMDASIEISCIAAVGESPLLGEM